MIVLGLKWTHQSGDLDASTSAPGIVDQNIDAGAWLQYFSELNAALLSKVCSVESNTSKERI